MSHCDADCIYEGTTAIRHSASCVDRWERLVFEVDHVRYNVGTVALLDANLESCIASHRDALLDARLTLYPDAPNPEWSGQ